MTEPRQVLPRTVRTIEEGMAAGLHVGAQVYVSLRAEPVTDFGLGEARPGVPMTADSMMIWFSSTKPVAAVAVAQLWERDLLDLDDPVARHIPEFAANGKEGVTVRHVLTHTGGFRFADADRSGANRGPFVASWDEIVARICAARLERDWTPGLRAGYHPTAGWFVLGELVRRLDGRPFERYVREEIFQPLGMYDSWVGMPPERYRAYGDRIGVMHAVEKDGVLRPRPFIDSEAACAQCVPGGGGRGPMRELGRFYEMLLARGAWNGLRILSPQTVEALTARHRVRMFDETFRVDALDWGLGCMIDYVQYGRHCSPRAFGHGGARSSVGFADPEHGLAVAVVTNGMPDPERHYRRFEAIVSAIYEDLGLAEPGAPGREHVIPRGEGG